MQNAINQAEARKQSDEQKFLSSVSAVNWLSRDMIACSVHADWKGSESANQSGIEGMWKGEEIN